MPTITVTRRNRNNEPVTEYVLDVRSTADAEAWFDMLAGLYQPTDAMTVTRYPGGLTVTTDTNPADIIATYQIEDTATDDRDQHRYDRHDGYIHTLTQL